MEKEKIAIYRSPGPHFGPPGKTYECSGVYVDELHEKLQDGWFDTFLTAINIDITNEVDNNSAPTRAELEQKASELGVKVSSKWSDQTLFEKINFAMLETIN